MVFTPKIHAETGGRNLHQVFPDVHLHQEVIYSACFHVNSEEMRLLIKSFKALWVLCVPRRKLFKWPRKLNNGNVNSRRISMWHFYLSVYPHFGMLLSRRPPDSLPLFRWIHINTGQNYFKFWMYWSWRIQAPFYNLQRNLG